MGLAVAIVARMPDGVGLRDHAPEGVADDDRLLDPQGVAEAPHVVPPLGQGPEGGIAAITPAAAPMIIDHHLGDIGQGLHHVPHVAVVGGPSVQRHHGGALDPSGPVRDQLGAQDLNEQAHAIYGNEHRRLPQAPERERPASACRMAIRDWPSTMPRQISVSI